MPAAAWDVPRDASDQRRDLRGDRDLQHGGHVLRPRAGGGRLDRVGVLDPGGAAAVSGRDRHEVQTGQVETGNTGRLLQVGASPNAPNGRRRPADSSNYRWTGASGIRRRSKVRVPKPAAPSAYASPDHARPVMSQCTHGTSAGTNSPRNRAAVIARPESCSGWLRTPDRVRTYSRYRSAHGSHHSGSPASAPAGALGHRWNRVVPTVVYEDLGPGPGYVATCGAVSVAVASGFVGRRGLEPRTY
jgi:hypothetical protein